MRTSTPASTASSARSAGSSASWRRGRRRTSSRRASVTRSPGSSSAATFRGPGPARRPDDHPGPADGGRRLRRRVVRDRRAPGRHRLAGRPVHVDGPVVGRDDRRAARRFGRQRRRGGRPDGLRPGRAGRAGRRARGRRPCRRRRDPNRRRGRSRSPRASGRATGVVLAGGEEITAAAVVAGIDPEAGPDPPGRPGRDRAEPPLAGRQHPDAGHDRQGQPGAGRSPAVHRGRRRRQPSSAAGS